MIDSELVVRKINLIAPDLLKIRELAQMPLERFLEDDVASVLAERYLERAIGRMIDINYHLVVENGLAPPRDYYDSFLKLGGLTVLPLEFAGSIASCAGLRNRITHDYDEINPVLLHAGLKAAARDIPAYLRHVQDYLASTG